MNNCLTYRLHATSSTALATADLSIRRRPSAPSTLPTPSPTCHRSTSRTPPPSRAGAPERKDSLVSAVTIRTLTTTSTRRSRSSSMHSTRASAPAPLRPSSTSPDSSATRRRAPQVEIPPNSATAAPPNSSTRGPPPPRCGRSLSPESRDAQPEADQTDARDSLPTALCGRVRCL